MSDETTLLTPAALLTHWQGHRDLTRRVIEAFPEDGFRTHHAPDMRPFQAMACELAGMVEYQLDWFRSGQPTWNTDDQKKELPDRAELLAWWDKLTAELDAEVPRVSAEMWLTPVDSPFGKMSPLTSVLYLIDNEIHHRAQGYVYLRELGVTPPAFYERSGLPPMG